MKLLIAICDRTLTKKLLNIFNEANLHYHITFYGQGTANSKILAYFGLEKIEKEIIFSVVDKQEIEVLFEKLKTEEFIKKHGAVAFTIPVDGISKNTFDYIKMMED